MKPTRKTTAEVKVEKFPRVEEVLLLSLCCSRLLIIDLKMVSFFNFICFCTASREMKDREGLRIGGIQRQTKEHLIRDGKQIYKQNTNKKKDRE